MRILPLSLFIVLLACKRERVTLLDPPPTSAPSQGEPCSEDLPCAEGLVCNSFGVCAVAGSLGTTPAGGLCVASAECALGTVCAHQGVCVVPGEPGTGERGSACDAHEACRAELSCYQGVCSGFEMPAIEPLDCPLDGTVGTDDQPYRVLFETAPPGQDYYQQPYPADGRLIGGAPDYTGHPVSGPLPLLGDWGALVLDAHTDGFRGFGANPTIFFRVAGLPAIDTVSIGYPEPRTGDPTADASRGTVALIDLTPGSTWGQLVSTGWKLRTYQPYLCDPWMALYPVLGAPLQAGHRYGAFVTRDLLAADGVEPVVDPSFQAVLRDEAPSDPALRPIHEAFQPLRTYLHQRGIPTDHIVGGTTFTVEDYFGAGEQLRALVPETPVVQDLTLCADDPGPHADPADPTRGCFGADPAFHEIQGTLRVPHIQRGTSPFATPDDGGDADWSPEGPVVQSEIEVAFTLTVPHGPPPAEGWPIVLFAPDAGQNYRAAITEGLASRWSAIDAGESVVGFAILTLDPWLSGPRVGSVPREWSERFPAASEPGWLYDNPLHPVAARDNLAQSALDAFTAVRWLQSIDWSSGSPVGGPLPLDADRIWFVGHGTGGRAGPLFVAHEPSVKGMILASTGGMWSAGFLEQRSPFLPAAVLGPALGDPVVDRFQPIVAVAQQIVDRTDAVNHALYVHRYSAVDRDVLLVVAEDPRVGWSSQEALARALDVQQVVQDGATPLEHPAVVEPPVRANLLGSTAVAVVNRGVEPHRLLFDDPRTRAQVDHFLATAWTDGRATLPAVP